jgi:hypothetical protein
MVFKRFIFIAEKGQTMKKEIRSGTVASRITPRTQEQLERIAKSENKTMSDVINDALSFYASFPTRFLKDVSTTAEKVGLEPALVISNLMQTWSAIDHAYASVFGQENLKTWSKAFRQGPGGGWIVSDKLFDVNFDEARSALLKIKGEVERDKKENRKTIVTADQLALLQAGL